MFDYRALYESQPSVSVDFLRVVQSTRKVKVTSLIRQYVILKLVDNVTVMCGQDGRR